MVHIDFTCSNLWEQFNLYEKQQVSDSFGQFSAVENMACVETSSCHTVEH